MSGSEADHDDGPERGVAAAVTGAVESPSLGTLDGEGEGVFVTRSVFTSQGDTYAAEPEFFGISGAFAGLRGEGTETGTTYDETGAFAPASTFTFEVSR